MTQRSSGATPRVKSITPDDIAFGLEHNAFDDAVGRRLVQLYQDGVADEEVYELINGRLASLRTRAAYGTLVPFRNPVLPKGNVQLGLDLSQRWIRFAVQVFVAGCLIISNTGGGKTTLLQHLVLQLGRAGIRVWLNDMYKTQLRHLRAVFTAAGLELAVLRARDWRWNLLDAGERDPHTNLAMAADLLVRLLDLPGRSRTILSQVAHELYLEYGIWNGRREAWPCLFDLYQRVHSRSDLNAAAQEALLDRLGALLTALSPRVAAYRKGWDPVMLAEHSIVMEMRGAPEMVKQALLASTQFALFQHEIERGAPNASLHQMVIFEDAQRFFSGDQHLASGHLAPLDELAGVIRGTGRGICISAQSCRGLSPHLLPNLATKIFGRLGSAEDYRRLGADLALTREQIAWARRNLRPGLFIAQLAEGRWREPFLFRVPRLRVPPVVDDSEVEASQAPLRELPVIEAREYRDWQPRPRISLKATPKADLGRLEEVELRLLQAVVEQPGQPSTTYTRRLRLSGRRAAEARGRLVELGLIREHSVQATRRGRPSLVLEPLDAAYAALNGAKR